MSRPHRRPSGGPGGRPGSPVTAAAVPLAAPACRPRAPACATPLAPARPVADHPVAPAAVRPGAAGPAGHRRRGDRRGGRLRGGPGAPAAAPGGCCAGTDLLDPGGDGTPGLRRPRHRRGEHHRGGAPPGRRLPRTGAGRPHPAGTGQRAAGGRRPGVGAYGQRRPTSPGRSAGRWTTAPTCSTSPSCCTPTTRPSGPRSRTRCDRDVVVVAAAGNLHESGDPRPYPAAYDGVLGVGAIGADGAAVTVLADRPVRRPGGARAATC